jgi:hypothetical protein
MTADVPSEAPEHSSLIDSAKNWVRSAAADAWSATKGTARVATQLGVGFATQAYEHPDETAAEVAGGIVIAGVSAEAGIGVAGAAAIAAVPAAGYGLYRSVQIARTEGISALPGHIEQSYDQAKSFVLSSAGAVATVYRGTADGGDAAKAAQQVQELGKDALPIAAGVVGGAGGELGQVALTTAGKAITWLAESTLPVLTLEPAYAGLVPPALAGAARGSSSLEPIVAATAATATGAAAFQRVAADNTKGGEGTGGVDQSRVELDDFSRKNLFVEGKLQGTNTAGTADQASFSRSLGNLFNNPEPILSKGGRAGNIQLKKDTDGWLEAQITDGPMKGTIALYKPGDTTFIVERAASASDPHIIQMPGL